MLSKKHFTGLFFIGILVMSGVAPVLADTFEISNTVISPLVVQFGDSVEKMAAIVELKSNFPRAHVVDFTAYHRIVSFKGPIIYVGHSSEEGIQYHGKTVSWDVLVDIISISKSDSHYMLGCEFSKITELTTNSKKSIYSFGKKVDALVAANVVSFHLTKSIFFASKTLLRLKNILQGVTIALPSGLGEVEEMGHTAAFIFIFFSAIFTATASVASKSLILKSISGVLGGIAAAELQILANAVTKTFIKAFTRKI